MANISPQKEDQEREWEEIERKHQQVEVYQKQKMTALERQQYFKEEGEAVKRRLAREAAKARITRCVDYHPFSLSRSHRLSFPLPTVCYRQTRLKCRLSTHNT